MRICQTTQRSSAVGFWVRLGLLTAILCPLSLAGCGSSDSAAGNSASAKDPKSKADSKRSKIGGAKSNESDGQRTIDGIPWDVFFDRPLEIAASRQTGAPAAAEGSPNGAPTVAANTAANDGTATTESVKNTSVPASASGKEVIDKDALTNEVKSLRNYFAGKTASVSTYNSSYLEIPPEAATLAVLAVAASKHSGEFTWKKNAKFVRELAGKIAELTASKDAKTKNTFEAVSDAFAKIDDILKGTEPAGLPEADDNKDYGDAIGGSVVLLMKRIKNSETILKSTVNSEAGLKKDAEKVAQEGAILAFVGEIITTEGFGWGGDAEFAKYARPLVEGGRKLMEASKSGSYTMYEEAMGRVAKSCNECHPKFKP